MAQTKVAIIGGSGVYQLDQIKAVREHEVETPFGKPSSSIIEFSLEGNEYFFLPRHGKGHAISPSEVNYRANIFALKSLGVDTIVSVSAVGSLQEAFAPNDFVIVDQFIDWTKGLRKRSFFDQGMVGHVSTAYPIEKNLQKVIYESSLEAGIKTHFGGSYLCIEGPQFSSRAESQIYRSFGAAVIGMTNVPEAYLAKEAGMAYSTVAMVTDYDCWKEEHCEVQEILRVMKKNYAQAQQLISILLPKLAKSPVSFTKENQFALITNPELLSEEQKSIVETLTK